MLVEELKGALALKQFEKARKLVSLEKKLMIDHNNPCTVIFCISYEHL